MPVLRLSRPVLRIAASLALLSSTLWVAATLWIDGPEWGAAVAASVLFAILFAWSRTHVPSNDRNWQSDVARLSTATLQGSKLTITNLRNFEYRTETDFTERWETRTYDLDALVGVDVFISFWGPTFYGHTITSWEFADGSHLAVSIETRKKEGEEYSAMRGFFRHFELYYVVADERDVIALRTNHRGEKVELYRIIASAEGARALLYDYAREMNALAEKPRWYNALIQNCTTTIWHHAKAVGSDFPSDWRLLANGYLVDLAYEHGSVDTSIGLDELKRHSDITGRARSAGDAEDFSTAIRKGLPPRPRGGSANTAALVP